MQLFPRLGFLGSLVALTIVLLTGLPLRAGAFETGAREAILIDMTTGATLFEKNADEPMPPASMSKIMTIYMVFSALKEGKISLDDTLPVSEHAWRTGGCVSEGSTMCLSLNDRARIEDLIRGVIVQSGNDASIVLAEGLGGSEQSFAAMMNEKAKEIGLTSSHFDNATGLPDPNHVMTVRDLATLAEHTIRDFPEYYHFYSEKEFTHNNIKQGNRNPLLYKGIGVDGLKTGHTKEAGYCLTASAVQGDRRLLLVVTGLPSMQARSNESERLLDYGFREFQNIVLAKAGEPVADAKVWLGVEDTVPLAPAQDVVVTVPRGLKPDVKVAAIYDSPIPAPIAQGAPIATLSVATAGSTTPLEFPLVAGASVEKKGYIGQIFAALMSVGEKATP